MTGMTKDRDRSDYGKPGESWNLSVGHGKLSVENDVYGEKIAKEGRTKEDEEQLKKKKRNRKGTKKQIFTQ